MPRRFLRWVATATIGVAAAATVDLFVFPSPRASPTLPTSVGRPAEICLSPGLRPGEQFADRVTLSSGDQRCSLHRTGDYVRSRHVILAAIDFYEIASYAETAPVGSTEEMLDSLWRDEGRKAYVLRFLVPVPGWQLRQAVKDEIARSFEDLNVDDYREDVDRLLAAFASGAHAGDVFYLVRVPGGRVYFGMRSERDLALATSAEPLARAIWRMWAGKSAEPGRAGLVKLLARNGTAR